MAWTWRCSWGGAFLTEGAWHGYFTFEFTRYKRSQSEDDLVLLP